MPTLQATHRVRAQFLRKVSGFAFRDEWVHLPIRLQASPSQCMMDFTHAGALRPLPILSRSAAAFKPLLTAALALLTVTPALAQDKDKNSDKTEWVIERKEVSAHLRELFKATQADHGTCLECYESFHHACEKWADYEDGISNARRWMKQAEAVQNENRLAQAHRALADMQLAFFAAKGKEKDKDAAQAADLYAKILADSPSDLQARFDRGRALAYAHRNAEAGKEFDEFLRRAPQDDPRLTPARRFAADPTLAAHRILPDIKITLVNGHEVHTGRLLGTRYVIDIWASWCPSCVGSFPELHQLLADYASKKIGAIGISTDGKRSDWEKALKKYNLNGAQALDEDYSIRVQLRAATIPRFIFVDNDGVVLFEGSSVKELRQAVERVVGPKSESASVAQASIPVAP